jgi:predicted SprT family Zn-dependent metalloprotease
MFTLDMIKAELNRLSASVGDEFNIPVSINGRLTRTLGRVIQHIRNGHCTSDRMEFSKQFLETSTEASIKSVIAHEWAHYYVTKVTGENHGHDEEFKKVCAMVGCKDDKTQTKVERIVSEEKLSKYVVYCPTCGEPIGYFTRMCNTLKNIDSCTCKRCGGGNLYYKQNW